jgi:hypothetical protein
MMNVASFDKEQAEKRKLLDSKGSSGSENIHPN